MTTQPQLEEQTGIDEERAERFAGEVLGHLNGAAVTFMLSIGHQVGLFDAMAALPPSTSEQVARAAGLHERYVREWLGVLVTGGVVEYNPQTQAYRLPPEHAASLTSAAAGENLAAIAQFFPEFGKVEQPLVRCFREGGGVPYSEYGRFQQLMRESSESTFDGALLDAVLPLAPGLIEALERGIEVADVGCGAGHAINLMARAFPKSTFVGYDIDTGGLDIARREARDWGLENATFEEQDAARLDVDRRFALITVFDAVHDPAQPATVLAAIHRALAPDGRFLCADMAASSRLEDNIEHPAGPLIYGLSTLHCMTVSLAYGGVGLGTAWGEQKAVEMLGEAGFRDIEVKRVEGDALNNYYLARK